VIIVEADPWTCCDECDDLTGEWCARSTLGEITICLTCLTEVTFTVGSALRSNP
jgi:hypothetical protein